MRVLFLIPLLISILIVSQTSAQSTLALQEKCAQGAKVLVDNIFHPGSGENIVVYEAHYNKKVDKCFVLVSLSIPELYLKTLYNVFENKEIGYYSENYYEDSRGKVFSKVQNVACNSLDEFEALIRPYMEE
jgi:hypothetical protein